MIDVGVYIIQRGEGGPIKIGRSASSITRRIQTIQQCAPESLIELARIVDVRIESSLHEKFRRSRIRGEWFQPHADLIEFINSIPSRKE